MPKPALLAPPYQSLAYPADTRADELALLDQNDPTHLPLAAALPLPHGALSGWRKE
jgi:hypothetical protein